VALPYLINGVTLLAATAPALNLLLTKAKDIISFDRCCHLVFDDADVVLKEHGESTKKLFNFYQESSTGEKKILNAKYIYTDYILSSYRLWPVLTIGQKEWKKSLVKF
jgi:CRISPR/Cas system-associated endonuclease Cas1